MRWNGTKLPGGGSDRKKFFGDAPLFWEDLIVVNGHVIRYPRGAKVRQRPVYWPWGETPSWNGLAVDRYWQITAGESQPRETYRRGATVH